MIVSDLDGLQQELRLTGHMPHGRLNKSSYHLAARSILSSIYPTMQILEELPISVRKSEILYLDFYIPLTKIAIEVHGEQHYKLGGIHRMSSKRSGTSPEEEFKYQKYKDKIKMEYAKRNGIYIEIDLRKIKTIEKAIEYIENILHNKKLFFELNIP